MPIPYPSLLGGWVEAQLTSPYQPDGRTVFSRLGHSFIDTRAAYADWLAPSGRWDPLILAPRERHRQGTGASYPEPWRWVSRRGASVVASTPASRPRMGL